MSSLWNDVDLWSTFFALLAVLCIVFDLVVIVVALVARRGPERAPNAAWVRDGIGQGALWIAAAVATVCVLGSLYMSEVAKFPPCHLCWLQRICMYSAAAILLVAAPMRLWNVRPGVFALVAVGWGISTWHYVLERFPDTVSSPVCGQGDIPCETVWVWKFHFLSIPAMAWVGFLTIGLMMVLARPSGGGVGVADRTPRTATVASAPKQEASLR